MPATGPATSSSSSIASADDPPSRGKTPLSSLTYLTILAMMSALGTAVAARRQPTVGWPQAAWATLVLGGLALTLPWWPGQWLAVLCTVLGILLPVGLFGLARRAARAGRYGQAARWAAVLVRIRPVAQMRRWHAVWAAAAAFHEGDEGPARALRAELVQAQDANALGVLDMLAVLTRDWDRARWSRMIDVQSRALCELGQVEAGIETAGRALLQRLSWSGITQARYLWLAPLAFAGRVGAVDRLVRLLGLAAPLDVIWRATALGAAGREGEARALLQGLDDVPLAPALRSAVLHRLAYPPTPTPLGPSARAVLERAEVEIRAGLRLRGRAWYAEWVTLGLLVALGVGFAYQFTHGGSTNPYGAWVPRALIGGRWPEDVTQLLSYGFMHFGLMHLLVNSLMVAALGPLVASALGRPGLLVVFLLTVVGGGLAIAAFGSPGLTVGASAGAMGLLGAVGMILWRHPELKGTATGRAGGRFAVNAILLQTLFDLMMAQVSFAGHAGGLVTGALLAWVWMAAGLARRQG
jgi:membrane associated rhomboid family serine protease